MIRILLIICPCTTNQNKQEKRTNLVEPRSAATRRSTPSGPSWSGTTTAQRTAGGKSITMNGSSRKIHSLSVNRSSGNHILLLRISFPGKPIFIHLHPGRKRYKSTSVTRGLFRTAKLFRSISMKLVDQ